MKRLQDYFYIQTQSGCLGWVSSVYHGMDILSEHFNLSINEQEAARLIMKFAFKYLQRPTDEVHEARGIFPSMDYGRLVILNSCNSRMPDILGLLSPMLYKGLSARLATLFHNGNEIYFVRVSDHQAMPPDAYFALIRADIDSFWNSGIPIFRANPSRRAKASKIPTHIVVRCGDIAVPIADVSMSEISRALTSIGVNSLTDREKALVDFICTLCQLYSQGRLTLYSTAIWQHRESDGIQVGDIPITYGHKGAYEKTATICGDAISELPGRMFHFFAGGLSVVIDRVILTP